MSKHDEIIEHITSLKVGTKISVRRIATLLAVSEGTAYRAIKECETLGLVSAIPRVGTIRIEKVEKKSIEALTYAEVVNIVEGSILGGKEGMYKTLNKFVIGAMTTDAMAKYIDPGCLLIIGNREEAQKLALENDAAVLISGGFGCSDSVKELANRKDLPIISSSYDSFTIATMINRAISESLIKKDIILVEDIMNSDPVYLTVNDTLGKWKKIRQETNHQRYPVVDEEMRVVGIITLNELRHNMSDDEPITKIMSKAPITVTAKTTVAYAAHIMGWEGIELCAVVNKKRLIGVVGIQDVIKALQYAVRQPQSGETLEDLILSKFNYDITPHGMIFTGKIIPEMLDSIGTASWSSLNMLISTMAIMNLRQKNHLNISVDSIMTYFMKPVQIDSEINIHTEIIDMGRNFCKVQADMYDEKNELMAKTLLSAKIMRK